MKRYVLQKISQYGYVNVIEESNLERLKKYKSKNFYMGEYKNLRIIDRQLNKVI